MQSENILAINFPNIVSITVMGLVGVVIVGLIARALKMQNPFMQSNGG